MVDTPLSLSATRQLLQDLGLRPQKHRGQNFLIDGNIVHKSLAMASIQPEDNVVEIGPGLGTLTGALLKAGAVVHAVEIDPGLRRHLAGSLGPRFPGRFHLLEGDALDHPLAGFQPAGGGEFKIVANLPYAISTPWMEAVLAAPLLPVRMVLMLQKETAERFAAVPGTKHFSAITVFLHSAFSVGRGHPVARQCFYPVPDIDSRLFHLERLPAPHRFDGDARAFIRACFTQRRKQIAHLTRAHGCGDRPERWLQKLEEAGCHPTSRPEDIPPPLWQLF